MYKHLQEEKVQQDNEKGNKNFINLRVFDLYIN
jgi:hypothetical protein